jgi:hypothetical protein
VQRLELADRPPEDVLAVGVLGREELEGERGLAAAQELSDGLVVGHARECREIRL